MVWVAWIGKFFLSKIILDLYDQILSILIFYEL